MYRMSENTNDNPANSRGKGKSIDFDEYSLWRDFKKGDVNAYALIYKKYFFVLFGYGKKISHDHELVKDCIQELFMKIWNNRENLAETTSIKYYLFTSLRRKLLDVLRKPKLEVTTDLPETIDENHDFLEIADLTDDSGRSPQNDKVFKALNALSQHQQKLLDLKFQKNLSNKEIADEMGITIQSVYNAVFKALRSIRKHISSLAIIMVFIAM
jgi:RNA polymerase sigma factor (sigma-70 family)